MNKVDWSLAPEWADRVVAGPLSGKEYWANSHRRIQTNGEFDCPDQYHILESWEIVCMKPKQWSGPQDGLPPIDSRVMVYECTHEYTKQFNGQMVRIVAHDEGKYAVFAADNFVYHALAAEKFKLPPTAEQIIQEQRETAIREIMDIADVDCRVTAARLVDAGFKREVV
jgi:hypothetical protein